jgi:hypothetical protein
LIGARPLDIMFMHDMLRGLASTSAETRREWVNLPSGCLSCANIHQLPFAREVAAFRDDDPIAMGRMYRVLQERSVNFAKVALSVYFLRWFLRRMDNDII